MGSPFQYTGNLEETYLCDMCALIVRHKVPGMMEISRESTVKQIYISGGNVIHATSSDRGDRLGAHLYRAGRLSREQLAAAMPDGDATDKRFGAILIEQGLLTPAELYEALRGQMEEIVWSVFSWQQGQVSFTIGELEGDRKIRIHLPMRQVIIRGIKEVTDTKSLVGRLGKKTTVFRPVFETEDLIELALTGEEYTLLSLIDGQRTFFDVCNVGPFGMSENARLIYAFRLLGLIEKADASGPGTGGVMIRMGTDQHG